MQPQAYASTLFLGEEARVCLLSPQEGVYNRATINQQGLFMDRLFEFIVNHYILVSVFVALLAALFALESRRGGQKISAQAAVSLINRDEAIVLDIRDRKDFSEGHITGALHIPLNSLKDRMAELNKHKGKQIVVADKMGQHAAMAVKQLTAEGFENVVRLNGGVADWKASNLPLVKK